MKGAGGFGQPKPLPGQTGYGEKAVDVLEKETNEMEARLQILQERLRSQQMLETDAKTNAGSSKWKSSKVEKGSIRSYGKEISEKAKKKTMEISQGASLMSKSTTLPARANFFTEESLSASLQNPVTALKDEKNTTPKDITDWDLNDVAEWLRNLGVPQYVESFGNNEMIGSMILDITLEDLDYMNVKVLAHRKLILRAIEDLRQSSSFSHGNKAPIALLRTSSRGSNRQNTVLEDREEVQVGTEVAQSKLAPSKVHWSQLEPLTVKQTSNVSNSLPVNAADDTIDEEAERLAFQQAVEEWRRGSSNTTQKGKVVAVREFQQSELSSTISASAEFSDRTGEWVNPFSLPVPVAPSSAMGGGNLKGGVLDEDAEHAEFVKAVEEWRHSRKQNDSSDANPVQTPRTVSVGGSIVSNARQLADALANNLEKEKEEVFKSIQKRREDAERKLQEAAKELEALRQAKAKTILPPFAPEMNENDREDFKESKPKSSPIIHRPLSGNEAKNSTVFNVMEFDDEDVEEDDPLTSSVRIELVESVVGTDGAIANSDDGGCVIEYASDSD